MQLVEPRNSLWSSTSDRLHAALEDMACNIQIGSNFCIQHPDYKPLEVPADVASRFQQLPLELQHKYLNAQLSSFLYGIYYNGSMRTALAADAETDDLKLYQNLENNSVLGVDLVFYDRLHNSNSGTGYFDQGWQVVRQADGDLIVTKGGLTLHVQPSHLPLEQQAAQVGETVAIRLPRNRVQNGFYLAVGNLNLHEVSHSLDADSLIVRIYFNLTPEGAVVLMHDLTQSLNQQAIPFNFKALYNPADYNRYDSAVLYFRRQDYAAIRAVLQSIYTEKQSYFKDAVPLFTKVLAPGLSLAEEPQQKFSEQESFGTNRCQIIANGLLDAWKSGNDTPSARMASICHHFNQAGLELASCYLNPNAQDIYTPLD